MVSIELAAGAIMPFGPEMEQGPTAAPSVS
jgi:hypothetical protein